MKSLKGLAPIFLCTSFTAGAHGQEQTRFDLNFVFALPQGEFGDNLGSTPVGASAFLGGRVPESPFVLGTELTLLNFGSDRRLQLFEFEGVPVEAIDIGTSNNLAMGHLVARLQPSTGAIQPFLDVLAGLRFFSTRSRVDGDVVVFRNGLSRTSTDGDWAFSYGAGGGVDMNLYSGPMGFDQRETTVALNVGVRYLFGTKADYAREVDFQPDEGSFTATSFRSRTDVIQPQIGLRVKL